MEVKELIYKLKSIKKEEYTLANYYKEIAKYLFKINYNLMPEEEKEVYDVLLELGCDKFLDFSLEFKKEEDMFLISILFHNLMTELSMDKGTKEFTDTFPVNEHIYTKKYPLTGYEG